MNTETLVKELNTPMPTKGLSDVEATTGLAHATLQKIARELLAKNSTAVAKVGKTGYWIIDDSHPDWIARVEQAKNEIRRRPRKQF